MIFVAKIIQNNYIMKYLQKILKNNNNSAISQSHLELSFFGIKLLES